MPNNTEIERCENCEHTQDDCTCRNCEGCGHTINVDNHFFCSDCDRCGECCEARDCDGCGRRYHDGDRYSDFCSHCERCERCCECYYCEGCDNRVDGDNFCGECDRCNDCCECGSSDGAMEYGDADLRFAGEPSARYPRFLGLEIECQIPTFRGDRAASLYEILRRYGAATHEDGSVGNTHGYPVEIVTAPARGEVLVESVTEITKGLARLGAAVDRTCGLHAHVDVRDLTIPDVLKFSRLWTRVERAAYQHVAPSRRTNRYSNPWGDAFTASRVYEMRADLEERDKRFKRVIYGSDVEATNIERNPYKHESRYHGINYNSILLYGTIEFRLHQGTVNAQKILMWSAFCSRLVEYAVQHTEQEIRAMKGSQMAVLNKILGWRPKVGQLEIAQEKDVELIKWCEERRQFFMDRERQKKGLPVRRRPRLPIEDSEIHDSRRRGSARNG